VEIRTFSWLVPEREAVSMEAELRGKTKAVVLQQEVRQDRSPRGGPSTLVWCPWCNCSTVLGGHHINPTNACTGCEAVFK